MSSIVLINDERMFCQTSKLASLIICWSMISSGRKCGPTMRSVCARLRKRQSRLPLLTSTTAGRTITILARNVVYPPGKLSFGPSDADHPTQLTDRCDRILYRKCPGIECIDYRRYEPTVSDHNPVSAAFNMRVKSIDKLRMQEVKQEVSRDWAKKEGELLERILKALPEIL